MDIPEQAFPFILNQTECILRSYRHWLGKDLCRRSQNLEEQAKELFFAPYVVASSTADQDPILNYGNHTALNLWELPWDLFTKTPGRKTAEPVERSEREKFLDTVKENGFVDNYKGVRISSSGKRFQITHATVWNLLDMDGNFCGQAATFNKWDYL